jgi:16S rRNA (guanine(527)-N(7))-methyltransferase RsmG
VSEKSPEAFDPHLASLAPKLSVDLPDEDRGKLALYLAELFSWNDSTNLFGRLSKEDLARHALESTLGATLFEPGERIVDIGSGGGFPGIPLAVAGLEVTLLEPRERRAAFLRHVLRRIPGLKASVLVDRVEKLSAKRFTAASVRAVGGLGALIGKGDFLETHGRLVIWTADPGKNAGELSRAFILERELAIPRTSRRKIVVFRKRSTGNIEGRSTGDMGERSTGDIGERSTGNLER